MIWQQRLSLEDVSQLSDLVAPRTDLRLVQVVDEDRHRLPDGRPVGAAHPLVHRRLDRLLEDLGGRGGREVALLEESLLWVVAVGEGVQDARLGRSLLPGQEDISAQP